MPSPAVPAILSAQLPWLLCGAIGGYLLLMFSNPARASLRDGFRCIRRYHSLWLILGAFGFTNALFQLGLRFYFYCVLPLEDRPVFIWMREAWRDPNLWLTGSPESLWYLPPHFLNATVQASVLPAIENVAGIFNCIFSTFPLSAIAGLLLLVNWQGHHVVLHRAIRKRLGGFGWFAWAGIVLCALCAVAKPFVYALPQLGIMPDEVWFQWSPVLVWLAFLFEYLFGVCIQIYLILLAYCWVRGITVNPAHLLDFAIRRFSLVVRWAAVVMILSSIFIDLPLILKNFETFAGFFPSDFALLEKRLRLARSIISAVLLLFATMQITLTFHSESLGRAVRDHARFIAGHWWQFGWFLILAAIHFFLLQVAVRVVAAGLGDGTSLAIAWSLIVPWLNALVAAWLLASWVCLYKQCDTGRSPNENWIQF